MQLLADGVVSSPGYKLLAAGNPGNAPAADPSMADFYALKAELEAMPDHEVARLASEALERQQAKLNADAQGKEAARFYNRPEAMADFAYWCKVESWTLDEAVALLLGRNPHVVNPDALAAELDRSTGPFGLGAAPPKGTFHGAYERLRTLVLRAEALASPRLKPGDVVAWAIRSGTVDVPEALAELTSGAASQPQAKPGAAAAGTQRVLQWTQDELVEMRRYKDRHGTKATAEKYGVSEARIRKLAPAVVETPSAAKGLENWIRRIP